MQADLDGAQAYSPDQVREFVDLYLDGAERGRLDPILDGCVAAYLKDLDEDGQVRFKSRAKAFTRAYAFLSSILPYNNLGWEEALDLPELPDSEAAGARGARSVEGHPASVAKAHRFENARQNSDRENARVESDKTTERAVLAMVQDNTRLFKLFADNPDFRRWLADTSFRLAYEATD